MSKIFKRVTALMMVVMCVAAMSLPTYAASGYAKKTMKGKYSYTKYNCEFWGKSNFWDVWWGG